MLRKSLQLLVAVFVVSVLARPQDLSPEHREPDPTFLDDVKSMLQEIIPFPQNQKPQATEPELASDTKPTGVVATEEQGEEQPEPTGGDKPAGDQPQAEGDQPESEGSEVSGDQPKDENQEEGTGTSTRDTLKNKKQESDTQNVADKLPDLSWTSTDDNYVDPDSSTVYMNNPKIKAAVEVYKSTWNLQAELLGLPTFKISQVWPHSGLVLMPEVNKRTNSIQSSAPVSNAAHQLATIYTEALKEQNAPPRFSQQTYTAAEFLHAWRQAAERFKAFEPLNLPFGDEGQSFTRLRKDSAVLQDEQDKDQIENTPSENVKKEGEATESESEKQAPDTDDTKRSSESNKATCEKRNSAGHDTSADTDIQSSSIVKNTKISETKTEGGQTAEQDVADDVNADVKKSETSDSANDKKKTTEQDVADQVDVDAKKAEASEGADHKKQTAEHNVDHADSKDDQGESSDPTQGEEKETNETADLKENTDADTDAQQVKSSDKTDTVASQSDSADKPSDSTGAKEKESQSQGKPIEFNEPDTPKDQKKDQKQGQSQGQEEGQSQGQEEGQEEGEDPAPTTESVFAHLIKSSDSSAATNNSPYFPKLRPIPVHRRPPVIVDFESSDEQPAHPRDDFQIISVPYEFLSTQ